MEKGMFTEFYIEENIWEELEKHVKSFQQIFVVHGEKSLIAIEKKLLKVFGDKKYTLVNYGGECSYNNAEKILAKFNSLKNKPEIILAVGGGKCIDVAKIVAEKSCTDIFVVPTIASTCADTSGLSVVYEDSHKFYELYFLKNPPKKVFIDLYTIYKAPRKYLWAGMGDTLAKYYEFNLKAENQYLNYQTKLGKSICSMCKDSVLKNGKTAYDNDEFISDEFREVVATILISTGYVSNLIDFFYNCALAHIIFNSFTVIHEVEKNHLHGEVVAYGILVQLSIENKHEELDELLKFYKSIGLPTKLSDVVSAKNFAEHKENIYKDIIWNAMNEKIPLELSPEILDKVFEIKN
ncbi:MAG: iron-containing alcohol dehydrogenase [Fusobacteriaceae bacterium]